MSDIVTGSRAKEISMAIKITRADGTIEELGTVGYWHCNPLKRMWWNIRQTFAKYFHTNPIMGK